MRKTVVLFLAVAALCLETGRGAAQPPTETPHPADVVRWKPWRPADATPLSPAAAVRADLIRHVDVTEGHRPYPGNVFPLTGALIVGRTVWAAEVRPDGQWRWFVIVYERLPGGEWRDAARHELFYDSGRVSSVAIESTHAWMVAHGVAGARAIPSWDIFRSDGDVLHREVAADVTGRHRGQVSTRIGACGDLSRRAGRHPGRGRTSRPPSRTR